MPATENAMNLTNPQLPPFDADHPPSLDVLQEQIQGCMRCALSKGRTQTVFSDGNPKAMMTLIGEGPGQQEDETGIPFVGRAGQLLTKILESAGIDRQKDIYICNTVKCRPPGNRTPEPDEMAACAPFLEAQIYWVRPKIILLCGSAAVKDVLKVKTGITKLRGQWFETPYFGAKAMPIFHPSYLLRNASREPGSPKWHTWQDMKVIRQELDRLRVGAPG